MSFGNKNCGYVGFRCGEDGSTFLDRHELESPHSHHEGLIGENAKLSRAINPAYGDRIALSIHVRGDTTGVKEALEATLVKHDVSFTATGWGLQRVGHEGLSGWVITFRNISTSQLAALGKAVAEIEQERTPERGVS